MNKKGFVFIETIVVIIILTSSLLLLYSTFFNILQTEKTLIYYDDINYIYRAIHVRNELMNYDLYNSLGNFINDSDTLVKVIGTDNLVFNNTYDKDYYQGLINDLEVNQILILKNDDRASKKIKECVRSNSYGNDECNDLYLVASDDMISYIKSMYVSVPANYVMLFEFNSCDKNNHCRNYYTWIKVDL